MNISRVYIIASQLILRSMKSEKLDNRSFFCPRAVSACAISSLIFPVHSAGGFRAHPHKGADEMTMQGGSSSPILHLLLSSQYMKEQGGGGG